jgi:uncharacterized membrane protein
MTFISKLHPLLVHFPIAFVLTAAVAEVGVIATAGRTWRTIAVANIRAGAAMAIGTVMTGWLFASTVEDYTASLEWHRWLGVAGAVGALGAALVSLRLHPSSPRLRLVYRCMLFPTALLVAATAHLGGTLVWGAGFLQP